MELQTNPCLIAAKEVIVPPAANVDLLTLNPALTSLGIYLRDIIIIKKHTAAQHSLSNDTRDGS